MSGRFDGPDQMKPLVSFFVAITPPKTTSQQKGVMVIGGKPRFFTKKKVQDSKNLLYAMLLPHRPKEPIHGPLHLTVWWEFPWRKSERKAEMLQLYKPMDVRPDLDNLEKSLLDVMTAMGFWHDDGQISRKTTSKWWGAAPGIGIRIYRA